MRSIPSIVVPVLVCFLLVSLGSYKVLHGRTVVGNLESQNPSNCATNNSHALRAVGTYRISSKFSDDFSES